MQAILTVFAAEGQECFVIVEELVAVSVSVWA
jgi:hypothetical protein